MEADQQQEQQQQRARSSATLCSDVEDVYSDLYSTFSQLTSTTADDVDQSPCKLSPRMLFISAGACVCGLLFGYDTGVISGVLLVMAPQDISQEKITEFQKEVVTAIACLGSFFGSMLGFPLSDRYGRRTTMALCCVVFIIGGVWMALSTSLSVLATGRLVVGIAIGVAAQCVPVYLSEVSPANIRGTVLTLNSMAITGGQLASYIMALLLADRKHAWRYLFGLSAIPALIFLLLFRFMPESPRWLVLKGEFPRAHATLRVIYPAATPSQVSLKLRRLVLDVCKLRKYEDIEQPLIARPSLFARCARLSSSKQSQEVNPDGSTNSILSSTHVPVARQHQRRQKHRMEPRTRRALIVGCVLMFFQQASGFNAFMYYATLIFADLNVQNPLVPATLIALTNFLFTLVAFQLVDTVGKRSMLLHSIWIMTLGLLLASFAFSEANTPLVLFCIILFVASFASAMGNIPWSSVELLPLNRRSFGASCISCTNWLTNMFMSLSFLSLVDHFGISHTMWIFAVFTALNWIFVYYWYPEVKGLTLEEIGKVFENGIDVHYVYRNYH
ncbi:hypothetical protein HG536_0A04870 [Torulaspora globosa]|uniref:Major facilitator superfamily (MFS) profile domain-containing protein n=1 Tax=Torulaspora globosa TaxID=48254 RepID=A0A7G3ZAY6_9SACH|nr:uncharacterized protein HG536_0A04870 [Torulaspora globosa]QLL30672.1 hypothetical protein HG536_0A04870 [Torulaspora globosa]